MCQKIFIKLVFGLGQPIVSHRPVRKPKFKKRLLRMTASNKKSPGRLQLCEKEVDENRTVSVDSLQREPPLESKAALPQSITSRPVGGASTTNHGETADSNLENPQNIPE